MSNPESPQLTPLPVPADFPVTWESPQEAYLLWTRDRAHWPSQITPLEYSLWEYVAQGMNDAYDYYRMLNSTRVRRINTYYYNAMVMDMRAPEEMAARTQEVEEKIGGAMARLRELWEGEWLPEIQRHLAFWEETDPDQLSMPNLLDHLEETTERTTRLWDIHNRILLPMAMAMSLFVDFYQDLFEDAAPFDAYQLLEGFENRTVASGMELWALSRQALAAPPVMEALQQQDAAQVLAGLEESQEGREFRSQLDAYLQEFGHRGDKWGWQYPSWLEDPAPVIYNLQDYITQPDRDLAGEMAAQTRRREERTAAARAQLANYPQPMVEQFEFLLKAAQAGAVIKEDHTYWLDFRTSYQVRQVLLALGRRLSQTGLLDQAPDLFYLTLAEAQESAQNPGADGRQALVAQRKEEMARFAQVQPPRALGSMPDASIFSDPAMAKNPLLRLFNKLDGGQVQPAQEAGVVAGNPGSPGTVTGTARIVRTLQEAQRLQPGEILVTETTAPPWTPLFASAGGVVTETGGILSHSAVVAREYGIPAVVGADGALARIGDGQRIQVDGDAGQVRILAADAD